MSLPVYEDIDFLHRLPIRLKKKGNGWMTHCPFCGEGSSPWKTRLNVVMPTQFHNHLTIHCFNCGINVNIKQLVGKVMPGLIGDYETREKQLFIEGLRNGTITGKYKEQKINEPPKININTINQTNERRPFLFYQFKFNEKYFKPAKDFEAAVKFCKERKIYNFIENFKYCVHPDSAQSGMLIFPFRTELNDMVYGFQGRACIDKRFNTFCTNQGFKVYNLFGVDIDKPVVVCESIIDSFGINNSIAMVGADLSKCVLENFLIQDNIIAAFDNDKTGLEKAEKYANEGFKVFVWPDGIKEKDFNDLMKRGWTNEEITDMIYNNTFSGLKLTAKIAFKKMQKR